METKLTVVVVAFDCRILRNLQLQLEDAGIGNKVNVIFSKTRRQEELEELPDVYFVGLDENDFWNLYQRQFVQYVGCQLKRVKRDLYGICGGRTETRTACYAIVDLCKEILSREPID